SFRGQRAEPAQEPWRIDGEIAGDRWDGMAQRRYCCCAPGRALMRPRLWHRWFLLSAGLVLLALVALLWAQARGFERGLLGYARSLEQARLPEIAAQLAIEYQTVGSWRRIETQPRRWLRVIRPGAG